MCSVCEQQWKKLEWATKKLSTASGMWVMPVHADGSSNSKVIEVTTESNGHERCRSAYPHALTK